MTNFTAKRKPGSRSCRDEKVGLVQEGRAAAGKPLLAKAWRAADPAGDAPRTTDGFAHPTSRSIDSALDACDAPAFARARTAGRGPAASVPSGEAGGFGTAGCADPEPVRCAEAFGWRIDAETGARHLHRRRADARHQGDARTRVCAHLGPRRSLRIPRTERPRPPLFQPERRRRLPGREDVGFRGAAAQVFPARRALG